MRADLARALSALALTVLTACAGESLVLGDGKLDVREPATNASFDEPQVIAGLDSGDPNDDDPSLTADRLILCFNSKRDGGMGKEDIWCTKRSSATSDWESPEPQTDLNTEHRETGIALSLDGLALWFSSNRDGGDGGLDVYTANRSARDAAWSEVARVAELSSDEDDLVSSIDETGLQLLMARRMLDTHSDDDDDDTEDDYDVFIAQRSSLASPWQEPKPIDAINTSDEESDAFLVGAGLSLIFTRDGDLTLSRRASTSATFDRGKPIASLNSADDDRDAWSDAAFDYVVFSSDRDGDHRLYEATRKR